MKPRISIWMHGGVGGGPFSQGQPPVQNLVDRLAEYYDIVVYSRTPPNDDFMPKGFRVVVPGKFMPGNLLGWSHLIIKFIFNHVRNPYQALYACWGYPAGFIITLLGKIFQKPTLIHLQGGDCTSIPALRYGAFHTKTGSYLCQWAYNRCTSLVALTAFQMSLLRSHHIHRKISVIPFGVDLNRFKYQAKSTSGTIQFLHVGNQNPVKDQLTLLNTFSILKNRIPCHLTLIGEGPSHEELKSHGEELGLTQHVTFKLTQKNEDLPYFYRAADILIHTSVFEGQGLVINEAAACGALLAGTRVGVLSDMGDSCAVITPVGEPQLLADKILEVIQSPEQVEKMRKAAAEWTAHHDEKQMLIRIRTEINGLLEHGK